MLLWIYIKLNPHVTNGLSHPYHLDEPTFILGTSGVFFFIYISFIHKIHVSKHKNPHMGRPVSQRHIWGYSVYLCPIKRTPGLYELMMCIFVFDKYRFSTQESSIDLQLFNDYDVHKSVYSLFIETIVRQSTADSREII